MTPSRLALPSRAPSRRAVEAAMPRSRWTHAAQLLALAHAIERATEDGTITRAQLARALGMSRARITQVANLAFLAPDIQAAIAAGAAVEMHAVRLIATATSWSEQRAAHLRRCMPE